MNELTSLATPDALILHRIQFAANISFHILFPTITIALAWLLLFFKFKSASSNDDRWDQAYAFFVKVFALTFAMGVVSGITMSFQFGTNWPGFMKTVGNIAGPLLAYEVMTAFFLEATFLGIMLFGKQRVSNRVHTIATALVAFGTTMSAFWIMVLNSWMHTPAGYEMRPDAAGTLVAHATDWMAIIFNPSFAYRFAHMLVACFVTVSFVLAGLSAYRYLRGDRSGSVITTLRVGVFMAVVCMPLQIFIGDLHGLNTLKHRPAKVAAMEGIWETQAGAPAILFALPDSAMRSNRFELAIPKLASLYLTHDRDGVVKGLNDFKGDHPPVAPVFWAFRIMVGTGILMLLVSVVCAWQLRKQGNMVKPIMLRVLVGMTFVGWVATLAGWYVTEVGRQPWLVHGILTTAQAAAAIPAPLVASTLAMYLLMYLLLIVAYISVIFLMTKNAADAAMGKPLAESIKTPRVSHAF